MHCYAYPSRRYISSVFSFFLFCFLSNKKRKKGCTTIITYFVLGLYQYNTFLDHICAGSPKLLRTRPIERSRDLAYLEKMSPNSKPHKIPAYAAPPFFSQIIQYQRLTGQRWWIADPSIRNNDKFFPRFANFLELLVFEVAHDVTDNHSCMARGLFILLRFTEVDHVARCKYWGVVFDLEGRQDTNVSTIR